MNRHTRRRQEAKQRRGMPIGIYAPRNYAARIFHASLSRSGPKPHREENNIRDDITDIVNRQPGERQ